jgi:preprotein translocase subunit SecF
MFIVNHRKIFFILSAILVVSSIVAPFVFGVHFSTDFLGGSILEISYVNQGDMPSIENASKSLSSLSLGEFSLRPSGTNHLVLRSREITPVEKNAIESALSQNGKFQIKEERFNAVGPTVGAGLVHKSYIAISLVILCIVLFITFAFRKVSEPVSSWKYGLATVIALAHDVIIPTGIYIVFGKYFGAEVDLLFVTALLAILGYSVHDTIVVFDRVRENLRHNIEYRSKENFEETVGKSVSQTMGRSINTSLTIFLTLLALYFVGSDSTRNFAFTLLIGVLAGTYSSIFVASPLLVTLEKLQKKEKN